MQHAAATRTAIATAVSTAIDAGTGAGKLQIFSATEDLLAEIELADPCGTVVGPTLTLDSFPRFDLEANTNGTADHARIVDSDNNSVLELTVGLTGADLNFLTLTFVTGQPVEIFSAAYTAPV